MTLDQQIAQLKAAGKLQDFPALAKLAVESAKAAQTIAQINTDRARATTATVTPTPKDPTK